MDINLEEHITEERKLLHDLSNKILVANGMLTLVKKSTEKTGEMSEQETERLEKCQISLKEITELVKARREKIYNVLGIN